MRYMLLKNKGNLQSCRNYRGIKLMRHTMKLWKNLLKLSQVEVQNGIMLEKQLVEKYSKGQKEFDCVFVDLQKDMEGEERWWCRT